MLRKSDAPESSATDSRAPSLNISGRVVPAECEVIDANQRQSQQGTQSLFEPDGYSSEHAWRYRQRIAAKRAREAKVDAASGRRMPRSRSQHEEHFRGQKSHS